MKQLFDLKQDLLALVLFPWKEYFSERRFCNLIFLRYSENLILFIIYLNFTELTPHVQWALAGGSVELLMGRRSK